MLSPNNILRLFLQMITVTFLWCPFTTVWFKFQRALTSKGRSSSLHIHFENEIHTKIKFTIPHNPMALRAFHSFLYILHKYQRQPSLQPLLNEQNLRFMYEGHKEVQYAFSTPSQSASFVYIWSVWRSLYFQGIKLTEQDIGLGFDGYQPYETVCL